METTLTLADIVHGLAILLGLVSCFLGWYFFRFALAGYSFFTGAFLAFVATYALSSHWSLPVLAALLGGIAFVWLSFRLLRLALFLNGLAIGFFASLPLTYTLWPSLAYPIAALAGLILGVACFFAHRTVMIVLMSFIGAFLTVYGAAYFVGYPYLAHFLAAENLETFIAQLNALGQEPLLLIGVAILATVGATVQHRQVGKKGS